MPNIILDTGLLAEANLCEGANRIAAEELRQSSGLSVETPVANTALESISKSIACFVLLDRFTRLSDGDAGSTDALAAIRSGFQEHSLLSDSDVEWESVMGGLMYLLQRGGDFVLSEGHVDEVLSDIAGAGGWCKRERLIAHLCETVARAESLAEHLFRGYKRAA